MSDPIDWRPIEITERDREYAEQIARARALLNRVIGGPCSLDDVEEIVREAVARHTASAVRHLDAALWGQKETTMKIPTPTEAADEYRQQMHAARAAINDALAAALKGYPGKGTVVAKTGLYATSLEEEVQEAWEANGWHVQIEHGSDPQRPGGPNETEGGPWTKWHLTAEPKAAE